MYNEEELFDGPRRGRMAQRGWHGRGGPGGHRRGGRMRRGEIRTALAGHTRRRARPRLRGDAAARGAQRRHLAAEPRLGLPHPAAVEDEGLVSSTERDGKRVFEITEAGRDGSAPTDQGRRWRPVRRGRQGLVVYGQLRETGWASCRHPPDREVGQRGADAASERDRAGRTQAAVPDPRRGLSSAGRLRRSTRVESASNFLGATSRYASSMMPATSSQSGSRSSRTPSQPRPPT